MGKPVMVRMAAVGALAALAACAGRPLEAPVDSLTVARVMGHPVEVPPLLPQAGGNVWPTAADEGPRGTLSNPDEGLRPDDQPARPLPPRRGSGTPPPMPPLTDATDGLRQPGVPPAPIYPPLPRTTGRVIPTPQGPVTTTGGGPGYSTYSTPEGATGIAIPQGGTTTLMDADGRVRQVPTPR